MSNSLCLNDITPGKITYNKAANNLSPFVHLENNGHGKRLEFKERETHSPSVNPKQPTLPLKRLFSLALHY